MSRRTWQVLGALTFFSCCLLLFSPLPVWGQLAATATISGSIKDPSGAVVPKAKITATNTDTGLKTSTQTNDHGNFVIPALPVGNYTVTISKHGFQTYVATDIILHPGITSNVLATLHIGSMSTHVTVSTGGAQVQLTTSSVSSEISGRQVVTLPLNGRNYQSLSALMPGVTNLSPGTALNQGGFLTGNVVSINGMGNSGTLYTVDGIWDMNTGNMLQTTITPNPDTLQEVRILQNNYSVKYNLFGSNVVLLHTKSGTKEFHGSAFEYLRNDALDARNPFSKTVSPLKQNIFGYTLGGPFYIPHYFNTKKRKVFFFWSQQWVRQNIGSVLRGATPTAAMREGIFNTPITNPVTGQLFPEISPGVYQIPQADINPNSQAFLKAMAPLPNAGGFFNYINLNPAINDTRDDEAKGDYYLTNKLRLMAEYLDDRQTNANPTQGFIGNPFSTNRELNRTANQLAQIQLTAMLSSDMVNTASIAMNNYVVNLDVTGITQRSQVPNFNEVLPFNSALSIYLPQINFSQGYSNLGISTFLPTIHASDLEKTFMDNWGWLHGNHYVQAGLNLVMGTKRQTAFATAAGQWGFTGQFTGNAMADFLLGRASTFFQSSFRPRVYAHYTITSPWVQDTWKVTPRLTLNLGLRWVHMPPAHDQRGFAAIFDPALYSRNAAPIVNPNGSITPTPGYDPTNGLLVNGVNGTPLNFTNKNVNYFAPSVGFAWDVFGNGKTALRGGYGLTYTASPISTFCINACATNPPLVSSLTLIDPTFPNPIGAAVKPASAPTLSSMDSNIKLASVQTYSLSLEHQFPKGWLFSIAGAGNIVRNSGAFWNVNQALPDAPYDFNPIINTGTVFPYIFSPYYGYGAINTETSEENAYWNALEVSARHSVGHNLFVSVSYTWEHGLAQTIGNTLVTSGNGVQDIYHPQNDYGNTSYNIPQVLAVSGIWTLPWFSNASGFKGAALGGWKYSDITTINNGFSLDPGLSIARPGLATRPNRIAGSSIQGSKTVGEWFNTAAFAAPAAGFFGTAAPGSIPGPGFINFDMALYKDFHITENKVIQFRSEFFNIFNHTNYNSVSTNFGAGNYGHITSARDPRILEFALRFQF